MGATGGCLILAGLIVYLNLPNATGIDAIDPGEKMLVKCANPDCVTSYEIEKRDYYDYVQKNANPAAMSVPPLICQKCSKESIYRAEKCSKCQTIFFYDEKDVDFPDTCPECGYSAMRAAREKKSN